MRVIGLTGGIGSGKSTVAGLLAERGATIIDADAVAREVVQPGEPALDEIARRFGGQVLAPDGSLDRAAVAAIVFEDRKALADLEAITHPRIGDRIAEHFEAVLRREAEGGPDELVVLDHPLLVERGLHDGLDVVVVVLAPAEVRLRRLLDRGLAADDARARMRNQADDDERRAIATHVIDNSRDLDHLARQVDELLADLGVAA